MRPFPLVLSLVIAAAPALAQRVGERTTSPETMLSAFGNESLEEVLAAQVAAVQAHPLGTLENPVRVGGPEGERAYLARLRCPDGSVPNIGTREDAGVGAFGSIVGAYEIRCAAGAMQSRVIMDRYHAEHTEDRAPPGFDILPR